MSLIHVPNTQCTCSFPHSSCPVVLYLWATGDGGCFIHLVTWRHIFTLALQVLSNPQCMSANSCKSRRATAQACAGQCLSAFQEEKSTEAASQPPASWAHFPQGIRHTRSLGQKHSDFLPHAWAVLFWGRWKTYFCKRMLERARWCNLKNTSEMRICLNFQSLVKQRKNSG